MEDILGALLVLAAGAAVTLEFRPEVALVRSQLVAIYEGVETWITYALAVVAKRLLAIYLTVFTVASVIVINTVSEFGSALSGASRLTLIVVVLGGLSWLGFEFIRLWPVTYASIRDVAALGAPAGAPYRLAPWQFRNRHGRYPRNPLRSALLPIAVTALAFASTCAWMVVEASGAGVTSLALLPLTMTSRFVLVTGLGLSIGVPITIGYYVAKLIDPYTDTIIISAVRAVFVAAPLVTSESFDTLTDGGSKLNVPLEKLFPAIIAIVSPPIAVILTLHEFTLTVRSGFLTTYLSAFLSLGAVAGFSLWAFGVNGGDWPKKVFRALWMAIIGGFVIRFLVEIGAPQAAVANLEPHRGWFETQWASLCDSFAVSRDLIRQDWGFVKGVGRGVLALVGMAVFGAIAGAAFDAKSWPGKAIGYPIGIAALAAALAALGHICAILYGWFLACAS